MNTFTVAGATISYWDEGQGPPLLLVHAFPLCGAMWDRQVAALSAHYRVIVPDLRGFNASTLGETPTSLDRYADDLAALLDHLELESVTYGGLSMGGYIGFAFVRRHAARLNGLILADTRAGADSDEAKQGREKNARLAEEQGPPAVGEAMLPKLFAASAPAELKEEVRRLVAVNKPEGVAAALRAMAVRPDSSAQLGGIAVPALIIVGAEDALTPPSESHAMHAAIPNSQLVEISGAGHLANLEAPEAFNAALIEFLGNV